MSGILKTFFRGRKDKDLNNCACKYLTSYNNNLRLFKTGLLLSENNILKIKKNHNNSTLKTNTNYTSQYYTTESNAFNTNYFYPKKNYNSFYEDYIDRKAQNQKLTINNNLLPNLTINKNKAIAKLKEKNENSKTSSNNFSYKKECLLKDYMINRRDKKKESKSLTTKDNCKDNSIEVEQIVHSLIDSNNENKQKLHHIDSSRYLSYKNNKSKKKMIFPKEKSISPAAYIDYNLKQDPNNKKLYRSFDTQLKCLNNKAEFRKIILNQVDTNYRNRLKVEDLKSEHNKKCYNDFSKKEIEELFIKNKDQNNKNLHFNLYDYYNNIHKMKVNSRYKFNKRFLRMEKEFKDNKKSLNFDKKLENFENSTMSAIRHLDSLSSNNRTMMKQILNIYKIYDIYDK